MIETSEIPTTNGFHIGHIQLNAPASLNALTLEMAVTAREQLQRWQHQDNIVAVVLSGKGRAFCAGGDVRRLRLSALAGDAYAAQFFEQEYRLDYAIHTYTKPLLCFGHGVVMGGGLGLMIGAGLRVITETTRVAMPEVSIGLYPDVGASWFLSRLPHNMGLFFGITGCELNACDLLALGWADTCIREDSWESLLQDCRQLDWVGNAVQDKLVLRDFFQQHSTTAGIGDNWHYKAAIIRNICNVATLPDVVANILAAAEDNAWWVKARENLRNGCPVTVQIVAEQLRRGRDMTLPEIFRMEWVLSVQCARHPDFPEGVRAQLVDKDRKPRWHFASIADVPPQYIQEHFANPFPHNPLEDLT